MPKRLNSSRPMMFCFKCGQIEVLSPSQWPTYLPDEGYVDREMTTDRLLRVARTALKIKHFKLKIFFFRLNASKFQISSKKKIHGLLQCWFTLTPPIQVVHVVVLELVFLSLHTDHTHCLI